MMSFGLEFERSAAAQVESILRRCGSMLLDLYRSGDTRGEWEGAQFKADADIRAHECLVEELRLAFPGIPVVSEEDESSVAARYDAYFIIDPIDGTASFAHGFPGWVTQAAYVEKQRPTMAGIFAPVTDEYFSAVRGHGAHRNGLPLRIFEDRGGLRSIIDNYPEPRGFAREAMASLKIPGYVESGSIALKICRIADETADLFVKDMSPRDWDVAAPMLVLAEAGGLLTDVNGRVLSLGVGERRHQGLIAARDAEVLDAVIAWLELRE